MVCKKASLKVCILFQSRTVLNSNVEMTTDTVLMMICTVTRSSIAWTEGMSSTVQVRDSFEISSRYFLQYNTIVSNPWERIVTLLLNVVGSQSVQNFNLDG